MQLLHYVCQLFKLPLSSVFAWTIVLNWLIGSPRRFKTYVRNRISYIVDPISPERWSHVSGIENPADSASRGLFPSELLEHSLWWNGPSWLKLPSDDWPKSLLTPNVSSNEEKEVALHLVTQSQSPVIPFEQYSDFNDLKRVTAWILRLSKNCRLGKQGRCLTPSLIYSTRYTKRPSGLGRRCMNAILTDLHYHLSCNLCYVCSCHVLLCNLLECSRNLHVHICVSPCSIF